MPFVSCGCFAFGYRIGIPRKLTTENELAPAGDRKKRRSPVLRRQMAVVSESPAAAPKYVSSATNYARLNSGGKIIRQRWAHRTIFRYESLAETSFGSSASFKIWANPCGS